MIRSFQNSLPFATLVLLCFSFVSFPLLAQDDKPAKPDQKKQQEDNKKAAGDESKPTRTRRARSGSPSSRIEYTKKASSFVKVFEPVAASMEAATVRLILEDEQVALGTVIDSAGLILTKASEIRAGMQVEVNGKQLSPSVIGIHPESDLALLRVEAKSLNVIQWSDQPVPQIGRWVASPKALTRSRPAVGIIATESPRPIPPSKAFVGITMDPDDKGIKVKSVVENSPAERAGLKEKDILFQIDDESTPDIPTFRKVLGQYDAGDRIQLKFYREDKERSVKLTLVESDKISPQSERSNQQNSMGSALSRRRKDFPMAFQHDSMLNSNTCGGPIVDLTGKAIGINIARAGRVSSLALPVSTVLPIIESLKSGELAPAVVNETKIKTLQAELVELAKAGAKLAKKKGVFSVRYNLAKGRLQEMDKALENERDRIAALEKLLEESKKQLEESTARRESIKERSDKYKAEYDGVREQLQGNKSMVDELEESLEQLRAGSGR